MRREVQQAEVEAEQVFLGMDQNQSGTIQLSDFLELAGRPAFLQNTGTHLVDLKWFRRVAQRICDSWYAEARIL